jgi:hypothetical protein
LLSVDHNKYAVSGIQLKAISRSFNDSDCITASLPRDNFYAGTVDIKVSQQAFQVVRLCKLTLTNNQR